MKLLFIVIIIIKKAFQSPVLLSVPQISTPLKSDWRAVSCRIHSSPVVHHQSITLLIVNENKTNKKPLELALVRLLLNNGIIIYCVVITPLYPHPAPFDLVFPMALANIGAVITATVISLGSCTCSGWGRLVDFLHVRSILKDSFRL